MVSGSMPISISCASQRSITCLRVHVVVSAAAVVAAAVVAAVVVVVIGAALPAPPPVPPAAAADDDMVRELLAVSRWCFVLCWCWMTNDAACRVSVCQYRTVPPTMGTKTVGQKVYVHRSMCQSLACQVRMYDVEPPRRSYGENVVLYLEMEALTLDEQYCDW